MIGIQTWSIPETGAGTRFLQAGKTFPACFVVIKVSLGIGMTTSLSLLWLCMIMAKVGEYIISRRSRWSESGQRVGVFWPEFGYEHLKAAGFEEVDRHVPYMTAPRGKAFQILYIPKPSPGAYDFNASSSICILLGPSLVFWLITEASCIVRHSIISSPFLTKALVISLLMFSTCTGWDSMSSSSGTQQDLLYSRL